MSRLSSYWKADPDRLREMNARWDLTEARWAYWAGDYRKAGKLLFRAMNALIIEPPLDSEEWKYGERKPLAPQHEQEEEKMETVTFDDLFPYEGDDDAAQAERDADGYLIR